MGFGVLRKTIGPQRMANVLGPAVTENNRDGYACPMCSQPMTAVSMDADGDRLSLDLCQPCGFVWFDVAEYEAIPPAPPPAHVLGEVDQTKMTSEAREKLAMIQIQEIAEQARAQDPTPDEGWKSIPGILGFPIEIDAPPSTRISWMTYLFSAVIVAISLAAFTNLQPTINAYGLIPVEVGRDYGLTLFTSFFLHVGWIHLIGNMYFLVVFGRTVENNLGPWLWLLLILLAALTGDFLHVLGNLHSSTPCVGASGGISGILAYYALRFPKMRLAMILYYRWVQFPAWTAFVVWVVLQLLGAFEQHYGLSNVASLAHLGGCIPGIFFYLLWGKRNAFSQGDASKSLLQVKVK